MTPLDTLKSCPNFGAAVVYARENLGGLSTQDLAELVGLAASEMSEIENGSRRGPAGIVDRIGEALGLGREARLVLQRHRRNALLMTVPNAVESCGCKECDRGENSRMHPGEGSRHDNCAFVSDCLGELVKSFPNAAAAHCPAVCAKRVEVSREERLLEATRGREGEALPCPGDWSRKGKNKKRKKRKGAQLVKRARWEKAA